MRHSAILKTFANMRAFLCVGIGLALVSFFLHTPHEALHPVKALKTIDWVGAAIFVASLTGFLVAISWVRARR